MARVGRFGRLPRSAPDLTREIVAMLREAQNAEDRAIYDAWQNGGEYKGEAVTDSRLLAHVKERRNVLDKKDPEWDHWNNQFIQLDFKIDEEEMILRYNTGRASEGDVAAFYRRKLGGLARNSQFYREVAGRAAQWAKSAVAGAKRQKADALRAIQENRIKGAQAIQGRADDIEYYIQQAAAREYGFSGDVTEMDATDMMLLLDSGAVRDGRGSVITRQVWQDSQQQAFAAFNTLIDASEAIGRSTMTLRKQQREYLDRIGRVNAIDNRAQLEMADDVLAHDLDSCDGLPSCELRARDSYAQRLTGLIEAAEAEHGEDANWNLFIGAAKNRLKAVTTGEPVRATNEDIAEQLGSIPTNDLVAAFRDAEVSQEALASGRAYWGQKAFGGPMQVIPVTRDPITFQPQLDPSQRRAIVLIDGIATQVVLTGQPVYANGLLSQDGKTLVDPSQVDNLQGAIANGQVKPANKQSEIVGYVFFDETHRVQQYAVKDPTTGAFKYVNDNPFAGAVDVDGSPTIFIGGGSLDPNALNDPESKQRIWAMPQDWVGRSLNANAGTLLSKATDLILDPWATPDQLRAYAETRPDPNERVFLFAQAQALVERDVSLEARDERERDQRAFYQIETQRAARAASSALRTSVFPQHSPAPDRQHVAPTLPSLPPLRPVTQIGQGTGDIRYRPVPPPLVAPRVMPQTGRPAPPPPPPPPSRLPGPSYEPPSRLSPPRTPPPPRPPSSQAGRAV